MEEPNRRLMTVPWWVICKAYAEDIAKYPDLKEITSIRGMLKLVTAIESSRYAKDIFGWTSLSTLCISQTPLMNSSKDMLAPHLRITPHEGGKLEFRFVDSHNNEKQWTRIVPESEGFERLEQFFDQLHWFR